MKTINTPFFHNGHTPFDYGQSPMPFGSSVHPLRVVLLEVCESKFKSVKLRLAADHEVENIYTNVGSYLVREKLDKPLTKHDIELAMHPHDFRNLYGLFLCNNVFAQKGSYMHPVVAEALRLSVGDVLQPNIFCPKEVNAKTSLFPTA